MLPVGGVNEAGCTGSGSGGGGGGGTTPGGRGGDPGGSGGKPGRGGGGFITDPGAGGQPGPKGWSVTSVPLRKPPTSEIAFSCVPANAVYLLTSDASAWSESPWPRELKEATSRAPAASAARAIGVLSMTYPPIYRVGKSRRMPAS